MDEDQDYSEVMNNPELLQQIVGNLPGVDPNSADIQNALQALTDNQEGENKDKKEEDKSWRMKPHFWVIRVDSYFDDF